jgi:hypothetical protein
MHQRALEFANQKTPKKSYNVTIGSLGMKPEEFTPAGIDKELK